MTIQQKHIWMKATDKMIKMSLQQCTTIIYYIIMLEIIDQMIVYHLKMPHRGTKVQPYRLYVVANKKYGPKHTHAIQCL